MISRRRFLTISAAGCLAGSAARAEARWTGQALGAEVSITLRSAPPNAREIFAEVAAELRGIESLFSLYDSSSALSRLNRTGHLSSPPHRMLELCDIAGRVHAMTDGRFDPSVQSLWAALANGNDPRTARRAIGWHHVAISGSAIQLAPGQSLTFNGIAQGYATDCVTDLLKARGFNEGLVNVGEFRGLGGPWRLALHDPAEGEVAVAQFKDRALATSSPAALHVGAEPHILNPLGDGVPVWSTVSVVAQTAALADGASTAFSLMSREEIKGIFEREHAFQQVHLVDHSGRYQRFLSRR